MHRVATPPAPRVRFAALAAALSLLACAAPASAAAGPSRTTATARGLAPVQVSGATALGALAPQDVALTLALAPRDAATLASLATSPHTALSTADFDARFAPSTATVDAVRAWAAASGLRVTSVAANRLLVGLSGSSTAVGRAFGVRLAAFRLPDGSTYFTPDRAATLPAALDAATNSVLGLTSLGRFATPHPRTRDGAQPSPAATPGSVSYPSDYGPQDLWSLYHAPSTATGSGQAVSVIAAGDVSGPKADLVKFEQTFGLPQVPWTQVNVGPASSDTSGNDEWDLDTQYSTGMAPDVSSLHVYVGTSLANTDIAATINRWVSDNATKQASFSAGECELIAYVSGFTDALDATLQQAAAQGQTLFTSSGDTGSFCPAVVGVNGVPAGVPGDNYPASSPFAIGVGGTTVLGSGPNEVTWYGSGGGSSYIESAPAFQQGAGGSYAGVFRGVPDVALDADPLSGYRVIVGGTEEVIGGTSASAPAWQGIWARAQQAHGGTLGFAGPGIYGAPASAFNDILAGTNGLYPTTPGWDYNTGRGTPDITAFVAGA